MPTSAQQSDTLQAIDNIRQAQELIKQQIEIAPDTKSLIRFNKELQALDAVISELNHAQNAKNDTAFAAATVAIKKQANNLKKDADKTKKFIENVQTAAKYVGYITKAFDFIAKL